MASRGMSEIEQYSLASVEFSVLKKVTRPIFLVVFDEYQLSRKQTKMNLKTVPKKEGTTRAPAEESRRQLVRALLIELMAYQFASPVRWIETQDVILSEYNAERVVEIGPSPTLVGMLRKTIQSKFKTSDLASGLERQMLWPEKDAKDVYYEHDPVIPSSTASKEPSISETPVPNNSFSSAEVNLPAAPVISSKPEPPIGITLAPLEDRLPVANEVLLVLLAKSLKVSTEQVVGSKSIKALTGGRSTLENEIIGDLGAEFGSLPERAEDMPVSELADVLQSTFQGQLGKKATTLINTLMGSKMPVSYNVTTTRKYLQSRWRLSQGRQDSILLLAVSSPPPTKLEGGKDANDFFDQIVQRYASQHTLSLDAPVDSSSSHSPGAVALDQETLAALTGGQQELSRNLLGVYAKHLGLDLDHDKRTLEHFHGTVEAGLREELSQVTLELGEDFTSGVKPRFQRRMFRSYDSSWAWALQELLQLYYEMIDLPKNNSGGPESDLQGITERCIHIARAAESSVIQVLDHMITKAGEHSWMYSLLHQLKLMCLDTLRTGPTYQYVPAAIAPSTTIDDHGNIRYAEVNLSGAASLLELATPPQNNDASGVPCLHLKTRAGAGQGWKYSESLTRRFRAALETAQTVGESFSGRSVLITGAGIGSIGAEVLGKLLSGGARVIVTTTRFSPEVAREYQEIYTNSCARRSQLVIVPFNQASVQDVNALVEYIYDSNGLNWDLDYIIPFAAIPENGRGVDKIDDKSELAHRIMLINLLRLLGAVKARKATLGSTTRPTQVILPLSQNHGTFGSDGLYGESKVGLETLFERWHSEDWSDYLSICGVVIGWTRGTGLMNHNDLVAEGIERLGVKTFSKSEMAHCLMCLMFSSVVELCEEEPLYVDLSGNMGQVSDLRLAVQKVRNELQENSEIRSMIIHEAALELAHSHSALKARSMSPEPPALSRKAHLHIDFPSIPNYKSQIQPLNANLHAMVDLDRVIVITGFAELGPWGNSRTRWEMEAYGEFSLEGCVEMAWLMNLIKYHDGIVKGKPYHGWVDSQTAEPVADIDIKRLYEKRILAHSGIRLVEPELFSGYNPEKKQVLHEIFVQEDLPPIEVPETAARQLQLEHGDKVDITHVHDSDSYRVIIRRGARLLIPKAMRFHRLVAGQIPTGWNPKIYGIPDDIVSQVDPVSLFTLVCTIEALLSSGITDPYEIYQYIHVSQAGNCIGSGIGGFRALQRMFKERYTEKDVQSDVLAESFINTVGAWVNMLLMSASGPLRTPVGACATALESLELGCDTIISGKAKFCLVGGVDDFGEELSAEFGNMKATSNTVDEFERGRGPKEMSRPTATTRSGFMESHGCGIQVITSASLAMEMGLPIRGVVAFCETASDKTSRSLPAPGKGLLSKARESTSDFPSTLLSISNRRKRLDFRRRQISMALQTAVEDLGQEILVAKAENPSLDSDAYYHQRKREINEQAQQEERDAQYSLGNHFWKNDPNIAPIRGAMATWGLGIDDLNVISFHGTSTQLNEKNECNVVQAQLTHLGRTPGNVAMGVFQKYLTGHPKGAAGAWMLNGALQILETGLVPGNRNADNIDEALKKFDHIAFLNKSIQTKGLEAISVLSFGFGQKGAQAICVHPKYLFATLAHQDYKFYIEKRNSRTAKADNFFSHGLTSQSIYRVKTAPPYPMDQEMAALLDPSLRFSPSMKLS
ncbi:fatty acid synthase subunit alpha, fungi type [Talaromyces islandicus]|uniref:Fatty acid synthase subunit alpha n=1 Tax=Talaromyces islandicus TaxID=28573 RepID=A0A0U1LZ58_TALIS|nr:fatty acid synthase subunit alpha, fungi type [Talaromyces islandicus]